MSRRASPTLLGVAVVAALVGIASPMAPAHALSCAVHPDGSPGAIVTGSEELATGKPFFDSYDFAVTGVVTGITTDEQAGAVTYGDTSVTIDVINAFGIEEIAPTLTVFQDDPGWMAGYPFEQGRVYFIPIRASGPNGEANYSMVCDPITELDAAGVAQLPALALDSITAAEPTAGVPAAPVPTTSEGTGTTTAIPPTTVAGASDTTTPPRSGDVWNRTGATARMSAAAVAVAVAAALIALVMRRRRVRVAPASNQ